jgi:D-lyxose ketol-isomerase
MISRKDYEACQLEAATMIRDAGIYIKDNEFSTIEVVDFGLSNIRKEGIQVMTFFATERISAKVLVLLPNQTEPEHWHPPVGNDPGKEEIIRSVKGDLRFYIPGEGHVDQGFVPDKKASCYSMRNEVILNPGDQLILAPGSKHWFQAGEHGAVMYSFSTCVRDGLDKFTDPDIVRETVIVD